MPHPDLGPFDQNGATVPCVLGTEGLNNHRSNNKYSTDQEPRRSQEPNGQELGGVCHWGTK